MRFIIIPLLLIGYLFWSYISIKDTIYCKKNNTIVELYTICWWIITGSVLGSILSIFSFLYW